MQHHGMAGAQEARQVLIQAGQPGATTASQQLKEVVGLRWEDFTMKKCLISWGFIRGKIWKNHGDVKGCYRL